MLVIVYVGAVAVLFLFVVMMLNINYSKISDVFQKYFPIGLLIGFILFVEIICTLPTCISYTSYRSSYKSIQIIQFNSISFTSGHLRRHRAGVRVHRERARAGGERLGDRLRHRRAAEGGEPQGRRRQRGLRGGQAAPAGRREGRPPQNPGVSGLSFSEKFSESEYPEMFCR